MGLRNNYTAYDENGYALDMFLEPETGSYPFNIKPTMDSNPNYAYLKITFGFVNSLGQMVEPMVDKHIMSRAHYYWDIESGAYGDGTE